MVRFAFGHAAVLLLAVAAHEGLECRPDATSDEFDEDIVLLLQTQKHTSHRPPRRSTKELEEAYKMLEEDTQVLQNVMAQKAQKEQKAPPHDPQEPSWRFPPSPLLKVPSASLSSLSAMSTQHNAEQLRQELQFAVRQRDMALEQAQRQTENLSDFHVALAPGSRRSLAIQRIRKSDTAVAAALAPRAVTTSSPSHGSSEDCEPDVITFHCMLSVGTGIGVWLVFGASVVFCLGSGYFLFKQWREQSVRAAPAKTAKAAKPAAAEEGATEDSGCFSCFGPSRVSAEKSKSSNGGQGVQDGSKGGTAQVSTASSLESTWEAGNPRDLKSSREANDPRAINPCC